MINWFDMPAEGLSNGGLFEVKELEVTENGTYETKGEMYNKVVVNVEGGGGSSDFSTAEVTFVNSTGSLKTVGNIIHTVDDDPEEPYMADDIIAVLANGTNVVNAVLYKGLQYVPVVSGTTITTTTGNVEVIENPDGTLLVINGDCTITIS